MARPRQTEKTDEDATIEVAVDNALVQASAEPSEEAVPAPVETLPDNTPTMTAQRAFAGISGKSDPVVRAFVHVEKLKGATRKLTRAQWQQELTAFIEQPR